MRGKTRQPVVDIKSASIKELFEELSKRIPKSKIYGYLKERSAEYEQNADKPKGKKQREIEKTLKEVIDDILARDVDPPTFYFVYPKDNRPLTADDLYKWFYYLDNYSSMAESYVEQVEGPCCCVDKAHGRYTRPEAQKLLEYIKQNGVK